ncbi:MAG TPA: hypothetical protein VKS25_00005 [Solirubrobacteraceae bacterium]|nr:hypothetical protein [Solirubrobacteraceae bacterium]
MSRRVARWLSGEAAEVAGRRAVMARDAGLRRISRVTRRVIVGAVALCGGLAVTAANAFHGHTIVTGSSGTVSAQQPSSSAQQSSTGTQSSSSSGLSAPAQAPAPTPVQPVVVSGGS